VAKAPRSVVLGTAGHIDHGKTTLVRALTGVDTDRLPEEKRRGITIELGFAAWPLGPDLEASVVDVPGHEAFVRTMVAGAGGIDAVILVVSAEDGVMPQTREHLNVCRLLGVTHGVVALTKIDRLGEDPESIALAESDVRESLAGSVFEAASIVPCSAHTGAGMDELRATVKKLVAAVPRRATEGDAIVPLDRVFSLKGHGTVVTGTLLHGVVDAKKDTLLRLEPVGDRPVREIRVRGVQVRSEAEPRVLAGSRIAINLGGIEVDELHRGDVLTSGHAVVRTDAVHAMLAHLPGRRAPWTHGAVVQVCAGTAFSIGHLDPLWRAPHPDDAATEGDVVIPPGREGLVRVRLETPLPCWHGQRLIVRDFSGPPPTMASEDQGRTMGGGTVVDPEPSIGRGQRPRWIALGRALTGHDLDARVIAILLDAGLAGIDEAAIARRTGVPAARPVLDRLAQGKKPEAVALGGTRWAHAPTLAPLVQRVISGVDRFHAEHPLQPGIPRAAAEAMLGTRVDPAIAGWAVEQAIARGAVQRVDDQGTLARPGKGVSGEGELPEHMQRVLDHYAREGITAPTIKEVTDAIGLEPKKVLEMIGVLQRTGRLVKVTQDLSLSRASHEALIERVRDHLRTAGEIDVQVLKQLTGLTRKYVVPFLEHLDALGVTRREGERRVPGPRA
jgi:selenocysteine-specific elongation factor